MKQIILFSIAFLSVANLILGQDKQAKNNISDSNNGNIQGFEFFKKISGLWNGPVSSTTPAGSFDNWFVDFRPISASQVSQYSLLDSNTVNNISFLIVKYDNQLRVAMRTEGCFKNSCCVTYEVMDSVVVSEGYYRFSDFVNGTKRAYTEFKFKKDEFIMKVYTNKFNKVSPLQLHTTWTPILGSNVYANEAISHFDYPQPVMVKDFTNAFKNMNESIFFSFENDPYKLIVQPYVGNLTVNISIDKKLKTSKTDEICLILSTEPFFEGINYKKENLKYISKYVFLSVETLSYTIKNVHPGKYYIYSYVDKNNDKKHLKGDYMCSNITNSFILLEKGNMNINTIIDFVIP